MGKTGHGKLGLAQDMSATVTPSGMPLDPRRNQSIGNLVCMASMMVWAAGFPAAEILLKTWDPLALIAARFCVAVLVLVVVWLALEGGRAVLGAPWIKGARIGGLAFGLGAWLLLVAQAATDAVTVSIIAAAVPIAAVLIEIFTEGRRLNWRLGVGLLASVLGESSPRGRAAAVPRFRPAHYGVWVRPCCRAFCLLGAATVRFWGCRMYRLWGAPRSPWRGGWW